MTRHLLSAALVAGLLAGGSASAATYMSVAPTAADGSISGVFGNDGGIAKGEFTNTFVFTWPSAGTTSGTISSSFTASNNDLNFTSVTLNGIEFIDVLGGPGVTEFRFTSEQMTLAGENTLVVKGYSPGTSATYSGTTSFTPGAVPEPTTWALMILGMGAAGAALRRRRAWTVEPAAI
jgi:hypothetical protein